VLRQKKESLGGEKQPWKACVLSGIIPKLNTALGHTEAVEGAFVDLRERFVGWDSANIEDIWQTAYRHRFYRGGEVLMSAISG
jgi:L-alanine-DL-glutamate epimerase-like enolase superfamily enzyme